MKLYKCISFSSCYWPYIAEEQKIRFATIPELLNGNDQQEFSHRWDSDSPAFQFLAQEMQPQYDNLYRKTAILSLGQSPNRQCWDEYCSAGGVRYEFTLDLSAAKSSEVNFNSVIYDDHKTFNLAHFMISRQMDNNIKLLFQSTHQMSCQDKMRLLSWLNSDEPKSLTVEHASNEIPFKKITGFKFENEFRFVHILEQIGPKVLKTVLVHQKVALTTLGLTLIRISTSDIDEVRKRLPNCPVEICKVEFP